MIKIKHFGKYDTTAYGVKRFRHIRVVLVSFWYFCLSLSY